MLAFTGVGVGRANHPDHPDSLERAAELRKLIPVLREKLAAEKSGGGK